MTDQTLIQKHLPQDLWEVAGTFTIADNFISSLPDIIEMVLRSRSIDTKEEKQNWFNLLPLMNNEQIQKLEAILIKEKTKLQEIEEKYEKKKGEIKDKYLAQWQEMGYTKQVEGIKQQESATQKQDEEEAEELLNTL